MGMALFAREGGLNSALCALSRSPDPKVIADCEFWHGSAGMGFDGVG